MKPSPYIPARIFFLLTALLLTLLAGGLQAQTT